MAAESSGPSAAELFNNLTLSGAAGGGGGGGGGNSGGAMIGPDDLVKKGLDSGAKTGLKLSFAVATLGLAPGLNASTEGIENNGIFTGLQTDNVGSGLSLSNGALFKDKMVGMLHKFLDRFPAFEKLIGMDTPVSALHGGEGGGGGSGGDYSGGGGGEGGGSYAGTGGGGDFHGHSSMAFEGADMVAHNYGGKITYSEVSSGDIGNFVPSSSGGGKSSGADYGMSA